MTSRSSEPLSETFPTRRCPNCGNEYPLTVEYWQWQNGKRRYSTPCRACKKQYLVAYRAKPENKERMRQYLAKPENKERRKRCRAKPENKERQKQYDAKSEVKERKKQQYATPEYKERVKQYRALPEVKERMRQYSVEYRAKSGYKERAKQYDATRRAQPADKTSARLYKHNRRARKLALPSLWTKAHERQMFETWHYCCAYCGAQQGFFNEMKMSADHYIPLGMTEVCPGTVPWNMVPACKSCNSSKQDKPPRQWLTDTFGKRKGEQKAKTIEAYLNSMLPRCPTCDGSGLVTVVTERESSFDFSVGQDRDVVICPTCGLGAV